MPISQVKQDTVDYTRLLRSVLQQDPGIITIGLARKETHTVGTGMILFLNNEDVKGGVPQFLTIFKMSPCPVCDVVYEQTRD